MRLGVSIRKQIGLFSMMAALVLFFAACQGSEQSGPASVHLTLKPAASKPGAAKTASAPAPVGITSVRVDVTGPEMTPISTQVPVNSDQEAVVQLDVPPGPARRFLVTAFDTEGAPRYSGEQTADLVPGASVNLTIEMVSLDITPGPTIQISPHTAVVPKDGSQRFSVTGADPSQVQFEVTSTVGNDPEQVGRIATDGDYSPPATILTDGSTPIGNPIPVTVTAINSAAPTDRDSATVTLTTGSRLTFDQNRRVTPSPESISTQSSGQRSIAFYKGHVYTVWQQFVNQQEKNLVLFSESADGIAWTTPAPVAGQDNSQTEPAIAVGPDGSIYVAFVECPAFCNTPAPVIRLVVRPPSENVFKSINVTMLGTSPQDPTVAVSSQGTIYVAWSANQGRSLYDILLQRIDKSGNQIDTSPKDLTLEVGPFEETLPALSISDNDEVFLAWEFSGTSQNTFFHNIVATVSLDGGSSFLPGTQVNETDPNFSTGGYRPTLAAAPQGIVYVAWERDECNDGCTIIAFNEGKLGTAGLEFQAEKIIGSAQDISRPRQNQPSIATDGLGGIYIAFEENVLNGNAIFLAKSTDDGATFTFSQINEGATTFVSRFYPSLTVDSAGRAFAIWSDGRLGQNQLFDVFFAKGE
ncbi:MAG: hypothetical protein EPO39_20275 [Candidatus Manganitrophaceae bacterium]|nr:MAG: hypothetical protein EPO39_20275 [Candidatus Manganitrophaceae bacterium]